MDINTYLRIKVGRTVAHVALAGAMALFIACLVGQQKVVARGRDYLVTATPLGVREGAGALCIAIDLKDTRGVWWWGAGRSGCAGRGSDVSHGEAASVNAHERYPSVHFRVPMHGGPNLPDYIDVDLQVKGRVIVSLATGASSLIVHRKDLNLPSEPLIGPEVSLDESSP